MERNPDLKQPCTSQPSFLIVSADEMAAEVWVSRKFPKEGQFSYVLFLFFDVPAWNPDGTLLVSISAQDSVIQGGSPTWLRSMS